MSVPQSELIRFLQNENMVVYNNRALANQCRTLVFEIYKPLLAVAASTFFFWDHCLTLADEVVPPRSLTDLY